MSLFATSLRWFRPCPFPWLGASLSLWVTPERERCASRRWPTQKQGWFPWRWDAGVHRTDPAQPVIAAPSPCWEAHRTVFPSTAPHTISIPTLR